MNKTNKLAAAFVTQHQVSPIQVDRRPINAFNALFAVQELDPGHQRAIEKILVEGYEPGLFPERGVDQDIAAVKQLTKELKAIKKQELILIGERVASAREIFKKYKEGSFRDWMELTFGSFKTGYNYLSFFDLYITLPEDLKERFKEMPAKAAYILASRKAPLEQKAEIVKEHSKDTASNLILLIQKMLGSSKEKTVPAISSLDKILSALEKDAGKLLFCSDRMASSQKKRVRFLIDQLESLLV
ncbi:MAG: CT583 family protein [Chlamydiota bacterium]